MHTTGTCRSYPKGTTHTTRENRGYNRSETQRIRKVASKKCERAVGQLVQIGVENEWEPSKAIRTFAKELFSRSLSTQPVEDGFNIQKHEASLSPTQPALLKPKRSTVAIITSNLVGRVRRRLQQLDVEQKLAIRSDLLRGQSCCGHVAFVPRRLRTAGLFVRRRRLADNSFCMDDGASS